MVIIIIIILLLPRDVLMTICLTSSTITKDTLTKSNYETKAIIANDVKRLSKFFHISFASIFIVKNLDLTCLGFC